MGECSISYTTLRLDWTNYDPVIHDEPDSFIANLVKLTPAQTVQEGYSASDCVWADSTDLATATWLLENPGFAVLIDLVTLEERYDDPNDPNPDPYEMLGNFYAADVSGDYDITVTYIS